MVTAGPAHFARGCRNSATARSGHPASFVLRLSSISIVFGAMALGGCARNPVQRELHPVAQAVRAAPVRVTVRPHKIFEPVRYSEPRIHRPDPALLASQPAPDCEFKRSEVTPVDSQEWARLKLEYERACFQNAEKTARERLGQLQESAGCEVEPPRADSPVRLQSARRR
jgi:hypothetical protein